MDVFVLLFNARTENEGIHTLKVENRNIVLMFEDEDDATRFALLLEAQDFGSPTVEQFEQADIEEFCQSANYECSVVPKGMLAVPPEVNVETPDWLAEQFPDVPGQSASSPQKTESEPPDLSAEELERIRKRLEGLL
jgi:hypothetical protein